MKKLLLTLLVLLSFGFVASAETKTITFDFVNNTYGYNRESNNSQNYLDNNTVITDAPATITLTKTSKTGFRFWSDGLRFLKSSNATMIFTVAEAKITEIVIDGTATFKLDGTSPNLSNNTWSGNAETVKLVYTGTSTKVVKTIAVTYEYGTSTPTECPEPVFSVADGANVYPGSTISVDKKGATSVELYANNEFVEGTEYTVPETAQIGSTITLKAKSTLTVEEGEDLTAENEITVTVAEMPLEVTFNFNENDYGLQHKNSAENTYETGLTEINEGLVSLLFTQETRYRYWETDNTLRVNNNVSFTVAVPEAYYITDISFTGSDISLTNNGVSVSDLNWTSNERLSSVTFLSGATSKFKTITVKYALRPTEIVNFTHDGIVSKAHVASLKYTLHVANHKDDSMYAVTLTLKDKDGVEVSATNEEHSLVEAPVAMAPARAATATHYLSGSVGFDDLTPEMTYTPTVSYGLKGAEPTGSVELPAITMLTTGIEDVTVDGNEAAEYFNLQGVRVAQPEAGQIYIVRRGAKVVKELVK